jgi:hypothetical protein
LASFGATPLTPRIGFVWRPGMPGFVRRFTLSACLASFGALSFTPPSRPLASFGKRPRAPLNADGACSSVAARELASFRHRPRRLALFGARAVSSPATSLASFGQPPFPPIVEAIGFARSTGLAPWPLGSFGRPDALASFGQSEDSPRIVPRPRELPRSWPFENGRKVIIESGTSRVLPFRCRVRYLRTSSAPPKTGGLTVTWTKGAGGETCWL